jgi:hypothetical protein
MSAIEQIVNKPIKEMTAIEYLIYEKYIQWNQNGRPKDPRNDKAGHDAIQAAAELTAMQARFEKLDRIKIAAGQVSKNLSKTEIIDIDNKEYNVWSIVGDAEKDELVAALKEAE